MPSDIALARLVLIFIARSGIAADTLGLVDGFGFAVSPIRRFREVAVDKAGATPEQAFYAAIAWVKAGRPTTAEAL